MNKRRKNKATTPHIEALKAELRVQTAEELLDALAVELLGHLGTCRYIGSRYRRLEKLSPAALEPDSGVYLEAWR